MDMPPLNLNQRSDAKTGDLMSSFGSDHSGFAVNFGNGVSQGAGGASSNQMVLIIAAVAGYMLWRRKT